LKTKPIRILHLDGHQPDRARVQDVLQQDSGVFELIEAGSAGEFETLLHDQAFDLVLSEFDLPGLGGLDVLAMVQVLKPGLPVIILTGSENGQMASDCIRLGAADLIVKSPASLGILAHKIGLVLDGIPTAETRLQNQERYNELFKRIPVGVYVSRLQPDGRTKFLYVSPRFCEIFGLTEADVLADPYLAVNVAHPDDREDLIRAYSTADEKGLPFFWDGRFIVEGKLRWVHMESEHVLLPDGNSEWYGVVMDISVRKKLEERVMLDEAIFTSFLENSPVYVFFKDRETRALRLSSNYENMLGMPVSQALGKTMDDLFPSELAKSMVADDLRILNEGKRVDVVEELNGRTYETTKFPIFRDGQPEMLAGFTMDITERVQAEQALRKSEAFNQAVISQSPIGISVYNNTGKLLFANSTWKKIWAISEEEYQIELQHEFTELEFEEWDEYLKDHQDKVRQAFAQGKSLYLPDLNIPNPRPGGAEWVYQHFYPILDEQGRLERMVTLTKDISEHIKTESELKKSRALLERAQEVAHLGSWELNLTDRTVTASPEAHRIYDLEGDVMSLARVQSVILPEYRPELDAALEALVHENKAYNLQFKIKRRSDGAIRDIHSQAEYNAAEHCVVGSIQDITERKLIMQVLMENEEKFRTLFERASDMILFSNVNDRILDANMRATELLGYSRSELLNMKISDLQAEQVRGKTGTVLKDRFKKFGSNVYGSMAQHKDGTSIPVEITLSRISIAQGIRFIIILRDVRVRQDIEQKPMK
jgi:PAS domain S-box-containing protein